MCLSGLVVLTIVGVLTVMLGNYIASPLTAWRMVEAPEPKPNTLSPSAALRMGESYGSKPQEPEIVKTPTEPMVLSLSYWEQSANAMGNLADLQCWAKAVNISKVVEPSITPETSDKSAFHFVQGDKNLRFHDLLNISHWNEKIAVKQNFAHLISQEDFFQYATKQLVYVWIKYDKWPRPCKSKKAVVKNGWFKFLSEKGFKLVNTVCIDLTKAPHIIDEKLFRDMIFDGVGHDVTVLFDIWRGIRGFPSRVALNGTRCSRNSLAIGSKSLKTSVPVIRYSMPNSAPLIVPSHRVQRIVNHFLSEYLPGGRYIAVMLRTEKLRKLIDSLPLGNNSCTGTIVSDWKTMANDRNITKTLFFSDIGQHGSMKWKNTYALKFSQYVHNSINLTLSLEQVNSILEGLTDSKDSVQIAFLHQQLVARATCVVIVGGGGFQSHTVHTYLHLHEGQECYSIRGSNCASSYIQHVYG